MSASSHRKKFSTVVSVFFLFIQSPVLVNCAKNRGAPLIVSEVDPAPDLSLISTNDESEEESAECPSLRPRCATKDTALCFYGQLRELEQDRVDHLRRNLMEPLCADVFVVGEDETEFDHKVQLLGQDVKAVAKEPARSAEEMNELIDQAGGDLAAMFKVGGDWLGGLRDPNSGEVMASSTAHIQLKWSKCMQIISEWERTQRFGSYAHIAISRTDLHWVLPHPRIEKLASEHVWTFRSTATEPHVEGQITITDHHILANRSIAEKVFAPMWREYASGELLRSGLNLNKMTSEKLLESLILRQGVSLRRLPTVGVLVCDHNNYKTYLSTCETLDFHGQSGFFDKKGEQVKALRGVIGHRGIKSTRPYPAKEAINQWMRIKQWAVELERLQESLGGLYNIQELLDIAKNQTKP